MKHRGRFSPKAILATVARVALRGDVVLLALFIAIIALLVLQIPPAVLDALIAVNITVSIGLLMLSIYVGSPLGLSTFPSLLLFTTLLRLSLNIASTKQILLHANAGQIIDAFGRFVVGGNVVVGIVVFLIIAIVQFIVIAKGSERVAEVGARFTLDGMPGKQMSIDADLRGGIINKDEARRRRGVLEQESQFFGAMDGAMKFVKGDAIAGMIIAFVNIVAGIAVGMTMNGMGFVDALHRYTVLTVGDGMISQIPSLFVSIAAGVLITRVGADGQKDSNLGVQIGRQVFHHPIALALTAVVLLAFVLTPGFPKLQFAVIALALGGAAWFVSQSAGRRRSFENTPMPSMASERGAGGETPALIVAGDAAGMSPITIRIAPDCANLFSPKDLDAALSDARLRIKRELGIPFPGVVMRYDDALEDGVFAIDVHELPRCLGRLQPGRFGEGASPAALGLAPHSLVPAWGPFGAGVWVEGEIQEPDDEGGVRWHLAGEVLARNVEWAVSSQPELFVGFAEAHQLVEEVAKKSPELTQELLRAVPLQRTTDVLRRLVQEQVSIRPMREICESLLAWGPREKDPVLLTEYVRIELGRYIAHRFSDGTQTLSVLMLDPAVEQVVRQAIQQSSAGSYLALGPEETRQILDAIERALRRPAGEEPVSVLMSSMDVRRYVRRMLEKRFPALTVLSYQEIGSHATLNTVGLVSLEREALVA